MLTLSLNLALTLASWVVQAIYDAKQRTELDMARREQEMKQLQGELARLAASGLLDCV